MNRPDRTPLSRDRILDAAIALADEHGPASLTMRRLGQVLDVEAMSLYHHVNGREDLLEGMVARLVESVHIPTGEELGPAGGWQAFLQHVAHEIRLLAVEHPSLFPLVATRPPAAPWLRPRSRSPSWAASPARSRSAIAGSPPRSASPSPSSTCAAPPSWARRTCAARWRRRWGRTSSACRSTRSSAASTDSGSVRPCEKSSKALATLMIRLAKGTSSPHSRT